jgi:hypothetical protein
VPAHDVFRLRDVLVEETEDGLVLLGPEAVEACGERRIDEQRPLPCLRVDAHDRVTRRAQ